MGKQKQEKQLPQFATFNAAYCSGFFIDDDTLVTTMCLLFEKIWLLNHVDLIIEFAKKFQIQLEPQEGVQINFKNANTSPLEPNYPFAALTPEQQETVLQYIFLSWDFCKRYPELLKEQVLNTELDASLTANPDITDIIDNLQPGLNTITIPASLGFQVTYGTDSVEELNELISQGAVPLLSRGKFGKLVSSTPNLRPTTKYLSSLLAMKAVSLTLPTMKPANSETILEARERLRDFLPPFWGAMFKLSTHFKEHLEQGSPLHDIEQECEYYIDATVRPSLIELNSKLNKDKKSWFHKILGTTAKETKQIIGKPPLTVAGLVSTGLQLGANVALDIAQDESGSQEDSSLTFLIELDKLIRNKG
jgi:hypothetical protein